MPDYGKVKNSYSSYVPTFVGSNYNELANAAETLDRRYRANKDYADKVAIMAAQDNLLEGDQAIKDAYVGKVRDEIAKIGQSDGNFENSSGAVSNLAKSIYTDPIRLRALDNAAKADQAKKLGLQYGADALNFGDDPSKFSTLGPDGQINRFNVGVEKRADYSKKMQELLGRVASDGYSISPSGDKITYDDYERYLIKSGQVNRLSKDKLHQLVDNLIPTYKSTGEGVQDTRRLTQLEGVTGDPIAVKVYGPKGKLAGVRQTNAIDEDIRKRFYSVADPQAFVQSQQHWEDFGIPVQGKEDPNAGMGFSAGTAPGSFDDNSALDPLHSGAEGNSDYQKQSDGTYKQYFDKRTGAVIPPDKLPTPTNNSGIPGFGYEYSDEMKNIGSRTVKPEEVEKDLRNQYNRISNSSIGAPYKNFEDYKAANTAAIKRQQKIAPNGHKLGVEQAESYDKTINRDIADAPLYISGQGTPTSLEKLAEKMGVPPTAVKLKAMKVFYDSPNKNLPGGYIEAKVELDGAEAKNAKNVPTTLKLPINDQFAALAQPINHLMQNSFYQGKDTYTESNPYFPQTEALNSDPNKPSVGFYTTTYPIPVSQQKEGEPGFKTIVHTVVARKNSSGGYDIMPYADDMTIGKWKENMIGAMGKAFSNALNSGQTYNAKDIKDKGLDY